MSVERLRVERLSERHNVGRFSCGNKSLDDWLRIHALDNQRRNLSRTFVLVDDDAAAAGRHAAARFIAVDPIDESARQFYRRFGFRGIDGDEHARMYISIDDALASFAAASGDDQD